MIHLYFVIVYGFLLTALLGLAASWADRKVTARVQYRAGPPFWQPLYDIAKLFGKETLVPSTAAPAVFLGAPIVGFASVVAVAAVMMMRLRFSWWPFHPLPLLFISTWAMSRLYVSFFIGWAIKAAILRIWGGKTFTNLKPFFIGVIMGQAAIVSIWVFIGGIYWIVTDSPPPFLPGWI